MNTSPAYSTTLNTVSYYTLRISVIRCNIFFSNSVIPDKCPEESWGCNRDEASDMGDCKPRQERCLAIHCALIVTKRRDGIADMMIG